MNIKNSTKRRILSLLTAFLMLAGLFPQTGFADEPSPYEAVLSVSGVSDGGAVEVGGEVGVSLTINGGSYASVQAEISYDADNFEYDAEAFASAKASASGNGEFVDASAPEAGAVLVTRYGPPKSEGGAAFSLIFWAKAAGEAQFGADGIYVSAPGEEVEHSLAAPAPVAVTAAAANPVLTLEEVAGGTLAAKAGGEKLVSGAKVKEGTSVTVTLTADSTYRLVAGSFKLGEGAVLPSTDVKDANGYTTAFTPTATYYGKVTDGKFVYSHSFVMPAQDVAVSAQTEKHTGNEVRFSANTLEHGSVFCAAQYKDAFDGFYDSQPAIPDKGLAKLLSLEQFAFKTTPAEADYVANPYALNDIGGYVPVIKRTGMDNEFYIANIDRPVTIYANFAIPEEILPKEADLLIDTAADLEAFRDKVNAGEDSFRDEVVRLAKDIDLTGREWTPIGVGGNYFEGTFDGDGHTVTLDGYGLFKSVLGAVLENIETAGLVTKPGGVIAERALNSIIRNCTNRADIYYYVPDGSSGISSGIVYENRYQVNQYSPYAPFDESEVGVFDCVNYGDITILRPSDSREARLVYEGDVGGVAHTAQRLIRCGNEGTIRAGYDAANHPNAALGYSLTTAELCYNTGDFYTCSVISALIGANEGVYNSYAAGDIVNLYPGTGQAPTRVSAIYVRNTAVGTWIDNCWATGDRSLPNWNSHWALSFQHLQTFWTYDAAGIGRTADKPTDFGDAFNEDGTLVWQRAAAAFNHKITFMDGDAVSLDIKVDGQTPEADGSYRLPNGGYTYSGKLDGYPVSGEFNVANSSKVIQLRTRITFSPPAGVTTKIEVSRDGKTFEPMSDARYTYWLVNGAYDYTATADGYMPFTGTFDADGAARTIPVNLAQIVTVTFDTTPADASLTVRDENGEILTPSGGSGKTYALAKNRTYTYEVSRDGYVGLQGTWTADTTWRVLTVPITMAEADASVSFVTDPANAGVELRDANGATVIPANEGGKNYKLAPGAKYTYTARAPYHDDAEGEITASDGAEFKIALTRGKVEANFMVTPADATVIVRAPDGGIVSPNEPGGKVYALEMGRRYDYTVSALFHEDLTGNLFADAQQNIGANLTRKKVSVSFEYAPANATLTVSRGGQIATPLGTETLADGAKRAAYTLEMGLVCEYTVSAGTDYVSESHEYTPLVDGDTVRTTLREAVYGKPYVAGDLRGQADSYIDKGGVYSILADKTDNSNQGVITIATTEPVTLVGLGTSAASRYDNLHIKYPAEGADLTLKDVYIYNTGAVNPDLGVLDFTGSGNKLSFAGVNLLDAETGGNYKLSVVHVPENADLTLGGTSDGESLYIYKRGQGAGVGGNVGEQNGDIAFTGGRLFAKSSKQGALIGSGANAGSGGTPGDIRIKGGVLNLISAAGGAVIGGSAGNGGAAGGSNVYIEKGANVNINVDYSGAAIGGGGYRGGNDADGGVLHYLGGSLRTFADKNAVDPNGDGDASDSLWKSEGLFAAGVSDKVITAARVDGTGTPVYPLAFDTSSLKKPATVFSVLDGDGEIYLGGLHGYGYVNEDRNKAAQLGISGTVDNWVPISEPNLYLYLTGKDHALTVNGEKFSASWNAEAKAFTLSEGGRYAVSVDPAMTGGGLRVDRAEAAAGETVTVTVEPAAGHRFVAGSLKLLSGEPIAEAAGGYAFAMPERDVTLTAAFEPIPTDAPKHAVVAADVAGGVLSASRTEAAEGESVVVTATPNTGYGLVPGSLKANGTPIRSVNGVHGFVMPGEPVTITAEFAAIEAETPNGALFKTGAAQDFVAVVSRDYSLFDAAAGVSLNGEKLPRDAYAVREGSTVVTIFASYLNGLPQGDYRLRVPFADGAAVERSFAIADDPAYGVAAGPLSGGSLTPDKVEARAGELVTVTVTPRAGFRFVPGSLKWDGRAINADAQGRYAFAMPAWDVTLTADFVETDIPPDAEDPLKGSGDVSAWVWDGKSIDVTWFDPEASSYRIKTPAQLAGLAALVNGLYNREIDTVAGDASHIRVNTGLGDDDGPQGNNKSAATYHYGAYDFAGKTVYLDNDIDMGDANYMPIGGQYLMAGNRSETRVDASFNGVFDGRGHSVTINADRRVSTGNYGDGSSVGLIGRLGNHDNEGARAGGQAVKNVAVYGSVRANRSVGGVVGKIGKTDGGAVIENCANFASVSSTDAKGVGGIVGAAWNGGTIRNCYNAGTVNGTHANPAGGIAGSVEIPIENSYSHGRVTAPSGYAMGVGTNNGGAPAPVNSYYLAGSAKDGGWHTGASADNAGERTAEYMKSDEFVTLLGSAFVKDTNKINDGYPVLKWQGGAAVAPPPVVEEGAKPSVNVPATTTVSGGEAVTVVEIPDAETPLANGESVRLVVNVDTKGEAVNKITAQLPAEFVRQTKESKSEIEVRSEVANVLLPEKAVAALDAEGKSAEVKAEKNEEAGTYVFTVISGGKTLASVDGGIKAAIPVKAEEAKPGTVAVLVREDGTEEVIKKSFAKDGVLHAPLAGSATIKIADNAKAFDDVAESAWYADAVKFATGHELFKGTTESSFGPDASMTRGMLVTALHRLEDEPEAAADAEAFADVGESKYYAAAVRWAAESGVVTGMGGGIFAPNAEITREQLAAILYRYAGALGLDTSAKGEVAAYMDAKDVSPWAEEAMGWAAGAGLIAGRANAVGTELAPKGTATRAEVAAMLERFIENIL